MLAAALLLALQPAPISAEGRWAAFDLGNRCEARGRAWRVLDDAEMRALHEGCTLLQLTADNSREDAHRFYERAGFTPSHIGFKRKLNP